MKHQSQYDFQSGAIKILNDIAKIYDMKLNIDKTKVMKVSRNAGAIKINGGWWGVGEKRLMVETRIRRKKNWIGHIMRGDGLMKEVMEGKMEGKRGPGRKRIGMIDDLIEKERYGDMKRRAEDRQGWRAWLPGTCRMAEH